MICPTPESLLTDPLLELNRLADRRRSTRPTAFLAAAVPVPPEDAICLAEVQDERPLVLPWHLAWGPCSPAGHVPIRASQDRYPEPQ